MLTARLSGHCVKRRVYVSLAPSLSLSPSLLVTVYLASVRCCACRSAGCGILVEMAALSSASYGAEPSGRSTAGPVLS